ncbi:hypothetical protein BHE74_00058182 [Ensete ventricosum]|nr:hypothetical protein BHE74_00058182 [Ensete ventricosum]
MSIRRMSRKNPTHAPRAYFVLCLCHWWISLQRVEFFRLACLRHILTCASIVVDLFSCESSFLVPCASGTVCLLPPS